MKHRGVSEVTGSVIMLGIVGAISALILTSGLSAVTNFQQFLIDIDLTEEFLEERFVVEFVEFEKNAKTVKIYVRNIGLNLVTIDSISIVETSDQNFILLQNDDAFIIQPRTREVITTDETNCAAVFTANAACILNKTYRITLVTDRGNIYSIETVPFRA